MYTELLIQAWDIQCSPKSCKKSSAEAKNWLLGKIMVHRPMPLQRMNYGLWLKQYSARPLSSSFYHTYVCMAIKWTSYGKLLMTRKDYYERNFGICSTGNCKSDSKFNKMKKERLLLFLLMLSIHLGKKVKDVSIVKNFFSEIFTFRVEGILVFYNGLFTCRLIDFR